MDDEQRRDDKLDEALEETFPASDPPANTPETGIALDVTQTVTEPVMDNRAENRFELARDGEVAVLNYERRPHALVLVHTEVPSSLQGHHIGGALVEAGAKAARAEGLRLVPLCPFAQDYLARHPDLSASR